MAKKEPNYAARQAAVAGGTGGALLGAGVGEKLVPLKFKLTPDYSWHMTTNYGDPNHYSVTAEALNSTQHNAAMAIGAGIGAVVGGVALYRHLKRNGHFFGGAGNSRR